MNKNEDFLTSDLSNIIIYTRKSLIQTSKLQTPLLTGHHFDT